MRILIITARDIRVTADLKQRGAICFTHFSENTKRITNIIKHFHNHTERKTINAPVLTYKEHFCIYNAFYERKMNEERHYYKSKPTMTYKMLETIFDGDFLSVKNQVPEKSEVFAQESFLKGIDEDELETITEAVAVKLGRRLKNERERKFSWG